MCEQLGIRYLVGGSLASSLHGIPRATLDVDLVLEIGQGDVAAFVRSLRDHFYLDEEAIRDAIDRKASFNLIDLESYFKADVFVARDDEPARLQMAMSQATSSSWRVRRMSSHRSCTGFSSAIACPNGSGWTR